MLPPLARSTLRQHACELLPAQEGTSKRMRFRINHDDHRVGTHRCSCTKHARGGAARKISCGYEPATRGCRAQRANHSNVRPIFACFNDKSDHAVQRRESGALRAAILWGFHCATRAISQRFEGSRPPCGQRPMDFEPISLAIRTRWHKSGFQFPCCIELLCCIEKPCVYTLCGALCACNSHFFVRTKRFWDSAS